MTRNAAYEIHEEADQGALEAGKLADLVILDEDPLALALAREDLLRLRIIGTVKEGRFVYRATEFWPASPK